MSSPKEKKFNAFVTDISKVMMQHKVEHLLVVFGMNGEIRNTYLKTVEDDNEIYTFLSDGTNAWLKQAICKKLETNPPHQ